MVIVKKNRHVFESAALDFIQRANASVEYKGIFTVVLSGGHTAQYFFEALLKHQHDIPWEQIEFFFGDERYVPMSSRENNYHMANEYLFSKINMPAQNIYPISTQAEDPKKAAQAYELSLRKKFELGTNEFPKFDLCYLGLGENAHTASLMPHSEVLKISNPYQLVASLYVTELNMYRITLTVNAINQSACIIFLVAGENKASAVWDVLEGPRSPEQYPAQLIHCTQGETIWYLDKAAAAKL